MVFSSFLDGFPWSIAPFRQFLDDFGALLKVSSSRDGQQFERDMADVDFDVVLNSLST